MRFIAEIRGAEERYAQAVEVLRMARDGQAHLPEGEKPQTATQPRVPASDDAIER